MIETDALVVAVSGKSAWVEASRSSSCGHCDAAGSCGGSLFAKSFGQRPVRLEVRNEIAAVVGDQVVLGLSERVMLRGSLRLYLLPLLGLFGGALLGDYFAVRFSAAVAEPWAIAGGLLGLSGLLLLVRGSEEPVSSEQRPVILRKAAGMTVEFPTIRQDQERL